MLAKIRENLAKEVQRKIDEQEKEKERERQELQASIFDKDNNAEAKKNKRKDQKRHAKYMKAYNEWINYDLQTAILATVGFFIQFYNYEVSVREFDYKTPRNEEHNRKHNLFKMNVLFLTILALYALVMRHKAREKWILNFNEDKCTKLYHRYKDITSSEEDRYNPIIDCSFYKCKYFWMEFILLSVTPLPYFHYEFTHVAKGGLVVTYRLEDVFLSIMAFRGFFLIRAIFNYSVYTDSYSKKLCQQYGFESSMIYAMLCELTYNPMRFISLLFVLFVTVYAYLLRIYEQPYYAALDKDDGNFEEMNSYLTALWLVIITVTTVGYGDYSACTIPGRIITVMIAIKGIFLMALVVGVVSNQF